MNKIFLGKTQNDKELFLVSREKQVMMRIEFGTGGEIPKTLSGGYTNRDAAKRAVTTYLATAISTNDSINHRDTKKPPLSPARLAGLEKARQTRAANKAAKLQAEENLIPHTAVNTTSING